MKTWTYAPNASGKKIPPHLQATVRERIQRHAQARCAGSYERLDIRFRGDCCYIDAYEKPPEPNLRLLKITGETADEFKERMGNTPLHLCRLRYYGDLEKWGLAFYTYSHERYELTTFPSGEFSGTVEAGFDVGSVYLQSEMCV